MENRYFYIGVGGQAHGPLWLGEMRRLWQCGRIGSETLVCHDRRRDWGAARTFPEITAEEAVLPREVVQKDRRPSPVVWVMILVTASFMWLAHLLFEGL